MFTFCHRINNGGLLLIRLNHKRVLLFRPSLLPSFLPSDNSFTSIIRLLHSSLPHFLRLASSLSVSSFLPSIPFLSFFLLFFCSVLPFIFLPFCLSFLLLFLPSFLLLNNSLTFYFSPFPVFFFFLPLFRSFFLSSIFPFYLLYPFFCSFLIFSLPSFNSFSFILLFFPFISISFSFHFLFSIF